MARAAYLGEEGAGVAEEDAAGGAGGHGAGVGEKELMKEYLFGFVEPEQIHNRRAAAAGAS